MPHDILRTLDELDEYYARANEAKGNYMSAAAAWDDFGHRIAEHFPEISSALRRAIAVVHGLAEMEPCDSIVVDIGGSDQTDGYKHADKMWRSQRDRLLEENGFTKE